MSRRISAFLLAVAAACLLPLAVRSEYFINLLVMLFVYVIVSESWNLLGGYTGQISLGHSAFFGVGALVCRVAWTAGVPVPFALVAGGLSAAVLAGLIGIPCLRMRSAYFPIGTLALAIIARITVDNLFPLPGSLSAKYIEGYKVLDRYYLALFVAVATVVVVWRITRSRLGLGLIAIRDDEGAAEAMGVRTFRHKILSLLVSSLFAGLGGGLFAYHQVSYYYSAPFELGWSFLATLTTFIGGLGTIVGPVIGSACFLAMNEIFVITLGEVHMIIFGLTFVVIVLFLPGGLVSIGKGRRVPAGLALVKRICRTGRGA